MKKTKYIKTEEKKKEIILLKASEHAREDAKNPLDFKWWDGNLGLITKKKYEEIKKIVYGKNG